jgi:hypothetical protein
MKRLAVCAITLSACSSAAFDVAETSDAVVDSEEDTAADAVLDTTVVDTAHAEIGEETVAVDAAPVMIGAFHLDGTAGGVLSMASDLYPDGAFTWELWFRGDEVPTAAVNGRAQMLVVAADAAPCHDITLGFGSEYTHARTLTFSVDGEGDCGARNFTPVSYAPAGGFANGRWYHVAAVRDFTNKRVELYVDGAFAAGQDYYRFAITKMLKASVGQYSDEFVTNAWFKGAIDELRFYNRRLTSTEIAAHFNAGKGQKGLASEPGLITGFHFDEPSGLIANAYSTTSRQITFSGGVKQVGGVVPAP